MTATKTIIFHVGTVKTGSTAIQKALYDHRARLSALGLTYLQVTPPRLDLPRYANADFLFDPATDYEHVRQLIETAPTDRIIISEEGLWGGPERMSHPVFDGYAKTIILYLRNPAELIASWAAENAEPYNIYNTAPDDLPEGFQVGPLAIETGLRQCAFYYRQIFNRFIDYLDDFAAQGGRVVVRPFASDLLVDGDALSDFLVQLGLSVADLGRDVSPDVVNPSRSRKFCDISAMVCSQMREQGQIDRYDVLLVEAITRLCQSGDERPVIKTLTDDVIAALAEDFADIEAQLTARFAGGVPILPQKLPAVFGQDRHGYRPVDPQEVQALLDIQLRFGTLSHGQDRLRQVEAELAWANDSLQHSLRGQAMLRAERDGLTTDLAQERHQIAALRNEMSHARQHPWHFLQQNWRGRNG